MGRHFSKVGATVILGPSNKKVRGSRPPAPGSDAYGATPIQMTGIKFLQHLNCCDLHSVVTPSDVQLNLVTFNYMTFSPGTVSNAYVHLHHNMFKSDLFRQTFLSVVLWYMYLICIFLSK